MLLLWARGETEEAATRGLMWYCCGRSPARRREEQVAEASGGCGGSGSSIQIEAGGVMLWIGWARKSSGVWWGGGAVMGWMHREWRGDPEGDLGGVAARNRKDGTSPYD